MTKTPRELAAALLEAQVEWVVSGLTGKQLDAFIDRDVEQFLAVAAELRVRDVLDLAALRHTARRAVRIGATSRVIADLATRLPEALHGDPAAGDHLLSDVVDRADVEALVEAFLRMRHVHTRALDRVADSPRVGTVASKFVTRIVADAVAQNREWAEKVPGVSSLFSLGTSAAQRVRNVADKPLDAVLADATDKGARFAIRRTNAAILDVLANAPVHEAAMEIWDLQAGQPVGELYDYLQSGDVTQVAGLLHRVLAHAAGSPYAAYVVDIAVTTAFDRYADQDLASFLKDLGVTRRDLVTQLRRHLPRAIRAMADNGDLPGLVRSRLEPFFGSAEVLTLLGSLSSQGTSENQGTSGGQGTSGSRGASRSRGTSGKPTAATRRRSPADPASQSGPASPRARTR